MVGGRVTGDQEREADGLMRAPSEGRSTVFLLLHPENEGKWVAAPDPQNPPSHASQEAQYSCSL